MTHKLLLAIFFVLSLQVGAQRTDDERTASFRSLALTRGWALGMWRVNNCAEHDEQAVNFKLSMTAQAFRYWLLMKEGLIEPNPAHEAQVARTFLNRELSLKTLKNPLFKDENHQGGFGADAFLKPDEYALYSRQFEAFVLKNIRQVEERKAENKAEEPTPNPPSD